MPVACVCMIFAAALPQETLAGGAQLKIFTIDNMPLNVLLLLSNPKSSEYADGFQ